MLDQSSHFVLPPAIEARWINPENRNGEKGKAGQANAGRKGSPTYGPLHAGEQFVLADYQGGPGVIRHIWSTMGDRSPKLLRGLRMDFYWDGADTPAISAPYGDFFGTGLGQMTPFGCALFDNPEGRNVNTVLQMPFKRGFKITVTNETDVDQSSFWAQFDFTINDPLPDDLCYLHAYFNRQRRTTLQQDYLFLPRVQGQGRYLGVNFGVQADTGEYFRSWWGEGEVKLYVDGDEQYPTLCGTGTEDYICTSWGQGRYALPYYGCQYADDAQYHYCFYRYHLPDPIYFRKDIRGTIQQLGCWAPDTIRQMRDAGRKLIAGGPGDPVDMDAAVDAAGYGLFEREDDWSSCAYFYLNSPANDLPPLMGVEERIADLPEAEDPSKRADV